MELTIKIFQLSNNYLFKFIIPTTNVAVKSISDVKEFYVTMHQVNYQCSTCQNNPVLQYTLSH